MSQIPLATPLAGIKVLEFSHTVMGPTAGLVFAELGADVIKVEPAPKRDHTRGLGGFGAGFFAACNRNKRSLAIDLKRKDGQAVIHRLIPTADMVLENFGPGTQAPGRSALLSGGANHRRDIVSDLGRAAGNGCTAGGRHMEMRSAAMMFAGLIMGVAGIAVMAGCTPTTTQRYACPAGVPWVPDDYANGKWVPGHCLGQPAQ